MAPEAYELLSMLMRYVFIALGGLILLRAGRQMLKDARAQKKELKKLPDAGRIGEVVDLETGKHYPLPREGMIGSSKTCDIRLRRRGVKRRHVLFEFAEGKGVRIKPCFGRKVWVEGVPIKATAYALHGTKVTLSHANIRIRLFAGLNVPHPAAFAAQMPDAAEEMPRDVFEMPRPFEQMMLQREMDGQPQDEQPQAFIPQEGAAWPGFDARGIPLSQELTEENDEAMPYFSPVQRNRRSDRR
ncbi:MAG: FHA domain-containing protein [Clostridia bacterium]|nr:FHA domain-containing protein [Clostridia bacterium]